MINGINGVNSNVNDINGVNIGLNGTIPINSDPQYTQNIVNDILNKSRLDGK